ncbi:hypothetical protein ABZ915_33950 [Streptomyces sp. NPDC046915]|uniref:hypothetical protein n=1 Tax=Streptomyces sp. NPDC046915 TaxID=3155257 RepID=UPI0033D59963
MIVPGLVLLLFVWHALLIKRHMISSCPEIQASAFEPSKPFTAHLRLVAAFGLILLGPMEERPRAGRVRRPPPAQTTHYPLGVYWRHLIRSLPDVE